MKAKKKFAEIMITTEECMCHGGRLWISDLHTNNHYELTHDEYSYLVDVFNKEVVSQYNRKDFLI